MFEKKMLFVLAVVSASLTSLAVSRVWTGAAGDGKWSTPENWQDGIVATAADDTALLCGANGSIISNDVENLSIARIYATNSVAITLVGEPITLSGVTAWSNTCPVTCEVPLTVSPSGNATIYSSANSTFQKDITCTGTKNFTFHTVKKSGAIMYLRGDILAPRATFRPESATPDGIRIYGRVKAKEVATSTTGQGNGSLSLYTPMDYSKFTVTYRTIHCRAVNVLCPTSRVDWSGYDKDNANGQVHMNGFDQTCNCMTGTYYYTTGGKTYAPYDNAVILASDTPATMTLNATASATSYVSVTGKVTILYAPTSRDFTQTFLIRTNNTSGALIVSNGTLKIDSGSKWTNVPEIDIWATGTLEIGEENGVANPFPALEIVRLQPGGKLKIPLGVALTAGTVMGLNPQVEANRTYSGESGQGVDEVVDWIVGAGTLRVDGSMISVWRAAVDGSWDDPDNWIGGVPGATTRKVFITEGGTARVDSDGVVLPPVLELGRAGSAGFQVGSAVSTLEISRAVTDPNMTLTIASNGVLKVVENGSFNSAGQTSSFTVKDGGVWRVDGGTVTITNFNGTFTVSGRQVAAAEPGGDVSVTSRVAMTSGLFHFGTTNESARLTLAPYSLFEATGGTADFSHAKQKVPPYKQTGGGFSISGTAVLQTAYGASRSPHVAFGTGEAVFSESSRMIVSTNNDAYLYVTPNAASETAHLAFLNNATCVMKAAYFCIGGMSGGTGRVDFASTPKHCSRPFPSTYNWDVAGRILVGYDAGYGELNISDGTVPAGAYGFHVARSLSKSVRPTERVYGRVNVSGGTLYVTGAEHTGWNGHLTNLIVGDGTFHDSEVESRLFEGEMYITGGTVDSHSCKTIVGAGYGNGYVELSDGTFKFSNASRGLIVGFMGGVGTFAVKGGTLTGANNAFVGGAFTNNFVQGYQFSIWPWVNRHDAEGSLKVSGGTVKFPGTCYVGNNGTGTVEISGTGGTVTFGNLVTSNTVASTWTTSSTLKFTLGEDGVSPITVTNKTTLTDNTKVVVDVSAYTGGRVSHRLIDCAGANVTADLDALDITFIGALDDAPPGRLELRTDGLYAVISRGMAIILR